MNGFLASAPTGTVVSSIAEMTNPYLCIGRSHAVGRRVERRGEYAVLLLYGRILGLGGFDRNGVSGIRPKPRMRVYCQDVSRAERLEAASKGRGPLVVLRQGQPCCHHPVTRGIWRASASCTPSGDAEQRAWAEKAVNAIWTGRSGWCPVK